MAKITQIELSKGGTINVGDFQNHKFEVRVQVRVEDGEHWTDAAAIAAETLDALLYDETEPVLELMTPDHRDQWQRLLGIDAQEIGVNDAALEDVMHETDSVRTGCTASGVKIGDGWYDLLDEPHSDDEDALCRAEYEGVVATGDCDDTPIEPFDTTELRDALVGIAASSADEEILSDAWAERDESFD